METTCKSELHGSNLFDWTVSIIVHLWCNTTVSIRVLKRLHTAVRTICNVHFIYFVFLHRFTVSLKSQQLLLWLPSGASWVSLGLLCEAGGDLFAFVSVRFWHGSSWARPWAISSSIGERVLWTSFSLQFRHFILLFWNQIFTWNNRETAFLFVCLVGWIKYLQNILDPQL